MNLIWSAYAHCSRTRNAAQIALYLGWSIFLILLSIDRSWLVSSMLTLIMLIALPICVYNDEHGHKNTR